jgi:hypothetical protein
MQPKSVQSSRRPSSTRRSPRSGRISPHGLVQGLAYQLCLRVGSKFKPQPHDRLGVELGFAHHPQPRKRVHSASLVRVWLSARLSADVYGHSVAQRFEGYAEFFDDGHEVLHPRRLGAGGRSEAYFHVNVPEAGAN